MKKNRRVIMTLTDDIKNNEKAPANAYAALFPSCSIYSFMLNCGLRLKTLDGKRISGPINM